MAQENQKCLKELESIHEEINRGNEETKREFLRKLVSLIKNWQGPLPNLRDIFRPEEIEWLLTESIKPHKDYIDLRPLVDFVINSGYKDEPKVGEDGKLILRRTTPIHCAIRSRDYDIVSRLFKIYDRFDVNYIDENGLTHFHVACRCSCDDVVEKFLELGQVDPNLLVTKTQVTQVDPNLLVTKTGDSPLLLAAKDNSKAAMELLLRSGADPNLANEEGTTPLHFFCQWEDLSEYDYDLIMMLFELSNDKYQPLQINAQDKSGRTPLHYACKDYYTNVAEWLLRNGADPNIADADGLTPLHIICENEKEDHKELAKILFKLSEENNYKVQVDAHDKWGRTPLQLALSVYNEQVAEVLLRNGAKPNLADAEGSTPLHIISKHFCNNDYVTQFFEINDELNQTVQVDAKDKLGWTPLQRAVGNLNADVVDALLDRGADLSTFVFPHGKDFCEGYDTLDDYEWNKLKLASGALVVVERLKKRGYELVRSDVMTVMEFFAMYELFEQSSDLEKWLYDDEEFVSQAKEQMINPSLSLHDVINLPPEKASKQLTYTDYFEFADSDDLWSLSKSYKEACLMHLCEKMSRGFFRRWALDPFLELTRYQLPILCCEIVMRKLKNEDLCNVCLAAAGQNI